MSENNYLPDVRAQYEEYPYPLRNPEDERKSLFVGFSDGLESISHYGFGGKRDLRAGCRVLVAGGGTGDSAIWLAEQLRGGPSEIVYLDISTASMKIAQERARIRELTNITWRHGSLLDVAGMGLGTFDYINCSGVLHHLADPAAGLRALVSVLADDGVMGLMVYGLHARAGVYQMQQMMRLLRQEGDTIARQIQHARAALQSLPSTNVYKHNEKLAGDVENFGDIGIYDLFLHTQDRAYSVPELYEWVESCGLQLLTFCDATAKRNYDPRTFVKDPALLERLNALPLQARQAVGELLCGALIKHTFYTSVTFKTPANPRDLRMVPMFDTLFYTRGIYQQIAALATQSPDPAITLFHKQYNQHVTIPNTAMVRLFLRYFDGERCLADIYKAMRQDPLCPDQTSPALEAGFVSVYEPLNQAGWMVLRDKAIARYPSITEYVEQQNARCAA